MRKRTVIIIAVATIVGLCIVLPILLRPYTVSRPRMPVAWEKLRPGMTHDQITKAVGELNDLRNLKGFDSRVEETTMIRHPCFWELEILYDNSGAASNAWVHFIDRTSSRFSSRPKTLF